MPCRTRRPWCRATVACRGVTTSSGRRGWPRRCSTPGSAPAPRSGCTSTTRPSTARRTSRRSRSAASRSTSTTATSTTSCATCSTTPTSRRWCSTPRWPTGWRGCGPRCDGLRLLIEVDDGPAPDGTAHVDGAVAYESTAGRDCAGGPDRRRRRRRLHLLHRRHDRDAEGRHVPDGGVHRVLPALVPADDRAGAGRGRRRAAGHGAADVRRRHPVGGDVGTAADARHRLLARDDGAPPVRRHRRAAGGSWARRRRAVERRGAGGRAAPHRRRRRLRQAAAAGPRRPARSLGPLEPAPDDLVGRDVLGRREARPDRPHAGAGHRRRARRDRRRHGHVGHDQGHATVRDGEVLAERHEQGLRRRRLARSSPGPATSAWWPTAGWSRSATTRIPRSRRARSAVVDGVRYSFPGDMATIAADGTLVLFGRGSNCINTGGEKVYPEEVEEALKVHAAVEDALVFGVPDDRFGERVVGVVSLSPGLDDDGRRGDRRRPGSRCRATSCPRRCGSSPPCRAPRTARPTTARPREMFADA